MIYDLTNISLDAILMVLKEAKMDVITEHSAPRDDIRRRRFKKIAESRVNRILTNLDSLGKCSNRRNYEYSDEEVRRIFREIGRKVKETRLHFENDSRNRGRFRL